MHDSKSLLDRRREGQEFSLADINRALQDAGDLAPDRGCGMEDAVCQESSRDWDTQSKKLVGRYQTRSTKEAWQGWSQYLDYRNEQETQ